MCSGHTKNMEAKIHKFPEKLELPIHTATSSADKDLLANSFNFFPKRLP